MCSSADVQYGEHSPGSLGGPCPVTALTLMSFINSGICLFYPSESKKLPKGYLYAKREDAGTGGEAGSVSGKRYGGREEGREGETPVRKGKH